MSQCVQYWRYGNKPEVWHLCSCGKGTVPPHPPLMHCSESESACAVLKVWHPARSLESVFMWQGRSPHPHLHKHIITHLAPDQPLPFATKSNVKGSKCVKLSWYTTLKINNKHQRKVSAYFVFFPVCEYNRFWTFHLKIKALKKNPKSAMSASEC